MDGDPFAEANAFLAAQHSKWRKLYARDLVLKELEPRPAAYADDAVFEAEVDRRIDELLKDTTALDRAMDIETVLKRLAKERAEGERHRKEAANKRAYAKRFQEEHKWRLWNARRNADRPKSE